MAGAGATDDAAGPVTLGSLFVAFLTVSLLAFGGPLVWARLMVVERRRCCIPG